MNEKFNKNANVEQLTKVFLSRGEDKGLIVKDPFCSGNEMEYCLYLEIQFIWMEIS